MNNGGGLKQGATDPFNEPEEESTDDGEEAVSDSSVENDEGDEDRNTPKSTQVPDSVDESQPESEPQEDGIVREATMIPYVLRRESITDERVTKQVCLQEETQELEGDILETVEEDFGENVAVIDLREAAYQIALEQHTSEIKTLLEQWGYNL